MHLDADAVFGRGFSPARAAIDRGPHDGDDYGDHRFNPGHPRLIAG